VPVGERRVVMGAWGKDQKVGDKVRMLGDGSAVFSKAIGLELDLTSAAWAWLSKRFFHVGR